MSLVPAFLQQYYKKSQITHSRILGVVTHKAADNSPGGKSMQHFTLHKVVRETELWVLLVVGLLYFWRPLLLGETLFFRDLTYDFIPQKQFFAETVRQGELPLWDIYRHGGQPYFGDPNNSAFHPSNLLYLILPFFTAFNLTLISHALLSLAGTYLFCRALHFSRLGSFVAAVSFGFSGYSLALINLFGRFLAMAYLPWLFLFWQLALHERQRRWYVLCTFSGVLQVLCGAPEVNVISMLLLAGWALCFQRPSTRALVLWTLLNVFILGISAIQVLPALEMLRNSSRGKGMDYQEFSSSSLHPKRLAELVLPNFSGTVKQLPYRQYYWGVALSDGDDYPYIINIYVGVLSLFLALRGALQTRKTGPLSRKTRLFLLAVFMAGLSLSTGRFLPGFRLLYEHVPLIHLFRYPIKFLIAGLFPLALLTGCGFDRFFSQSSPQIVRITLWLSTMFSGTAALLFLVSDSFAQDLMQTFFQEAHNERMRSNLNTSLWWLCALFLMLSLITHYHKQSSTTRPALICAALLCCDLLVAGSAVNVYAARDVFRRPPPVAQRLRQEFSSGRLFRDENPSDIQLYAPSNDVVWGYRWSLDTLAGYLGAFWKIPVIFHDDYVGLGNRHVIVLKSAVRSLPWPQKLSVLSAAGVTNILSADPGLGALPGLQKISEIPNKSNHLLYLYRNSHAVDFVKFIDKRRFAESDEQAIILMLQPSYDPQQEVILHEIERAESTPPAGDESCTTAHIETLHASPQRQAYAVRTTCDGFLLFSSPYYPGWNVSIDDKAVPQLRANLAFSAIQLPAGKHLVTREYRPRSLIAGLVCSLFFTMLAVLGALFCLPVEKSLNRRRETG
ncbi:hypothetical protein CSB45_01710 [candidate division KSB3 bacterium]|uniref:Membrane protein 6-pyruvoyl-tetrahydropterin synthase-related domain-containing protein n=1 Tax=candidate division KSB3 bacterium TaxID=2044937 RepID=A0A2G6EAQ6_9BACT|nr:MAG: hypothetical protein CSB45_01710 [candidate division KSB3 bacterium]PIE30694.1 MAG: hypothetical protein CSA57_01640 [candidate division KSB3 bacterium]